MTNPNNKVFYVTETYRTYDRKHRYDIREMCVKGKDLVNFILSYNPETHINYGDRLTVIIQEDEDIEWYLTVYEAKRKRSA